MIGDVLHEALREIERYRTDPATAQAYEGPEAKARIAHVTGAMRDLLRDLDGAPAGEKEETNGRPL